MLHVSYFTPDPDRTAEWLACLWQGPVPPSMVVRQWLYLPGEPRRMLLVWEGDDDAEAWLEQAVARFGEWSTEEVTDATSGMVHAVARNLDAFGQWMRSRGGYSEHDADRQVELRRRGLTAADPEAAAAAGRAWAAEA